MGDNLGRGQCSGATGIRASLGLGMQHPPKPLVAAKRSAQVDRLWPGV